MIKVPFHHSTRVCDAGFKVHTMNRVMTASRLGYKEEYPMTWKQMWNTVMHSRDEWPLGHPLHNLDQIALSVLLFICVIAFFAILQMERKFCRWERRQQSEYDRWLTEWQKTDEKN